MRGRPVVPKELREFTHDDYVNVYERIHRLPHEPRFFGTENAGGFGSWKKAEVLFLAQDCGVVRALDDRIKNKHPEPHGYGEDLKSNLRFLRFADTFGVPRPQLWGSVLGSLWRRSGSKSGAPPAWGELRYCYAVPMVLWVASKKRMPRLRAIACLGEYAWEGVVRAASLRYSRDEFMTLRDSHGTKDVSLEGRSVRLFPMYHPGARTFDHIVSTNWPELVKFLDQTTS